MMAGIFKIDILEIIKVQIRLVFQVHHIVELCKTLFKYLPTHSRSLGIHAVTLVLSSYVDEF